MNPKIDVWEQFWRVCGASRGLRTSLRLTGKTHLVAHPHGGRVLMLQYMENHLLKYPFQKIPMSPKKQERDGGSTYSGSIVVNTLQCTSCEFCFFCCHLHYAGFGRINQKLALYCSRGSSRKQFSHFLMLKFRGSAFCRIL